MGLVIPTFFDGIVCDLLTAYVCARQTVSNVHDMTYCVHKHTWTTKDRRPLQSPHQEFS